MKISVLKINNFCGIKNIEINLGGCDCRVYGDNATGKTTLAKAFAWLFTGKDITGATDLDPQPLDKANEKIHNIETSVEATVTENGTQTTYKRVLAEVWRKVRGSQSEELTGTKTSYFIDGVPLKESEFNTEIGKLVSSEEFKTLSLVSYFCTMHWTQRRKILIDICGDVSDVDVIGSNEELSGLLDFLRNGDKIYAVDEFMKIAKAKKSEIKKEIDAIPARISENQNALPQATARPLKDISADIKAIEAEKAEINAAMAASDTSALRAQKISGAQAALSNAENAYTKAQSEKNADVNKEINAVLAKKLEARENIDKQKSMLRNIESELAVMKNKRTRLLKDYDAEKDVKFIGKDTCPTCGQPIPQDKIEQAISEFNLAKSKKLEAIATEIKETCHKNTIAKMESDIESLKKTVASAESSIDEYTGILNELSERIDNEPFSSTDEYKRLYSALSEARNTDTGDDNTDAKEQIVKLDIKLNKLNKELAEIEMSKKIKARIAELTGQQKTLAQEFAHYEHGEYLCEVFVKTKVSMLDERINSRFKTLKFKLFHEQQNGGLQEICKVLIPCESGLVEHEKANNAAKINAGMEAIEILAEHFGFELPVFVDNAESVTGLLQIPQQTIALVVSEQDKALRFDIG